MVNKITTPPTQNEVIDKINELVDGKQDTLVSGTNIKTVGGNSLVGSGNVAFPTVDQTYSATSANAQSGVAVANAIAPKQDTLVSGTNIKTINGTSLLGSGNITIETSSTPNVDGETISYNSSDALQAIAVKNVRDGSTLPIWHGTEYQWNHGDPTTWYYWQTSVTALWTAGGDLPSDETWRASAYGNGVFIFVALNSSLSAYSTDNGVTWQTSNTLPSKGWEKAVFCDDRFLVISRNNGYYAYSTDNGVTWQDSYNNSSITGTRVGLAYGNNCIVVITDSGLSTYSTDNGVTWQTGGNLPASDNWKDLSYGNGVFVAIRNNSNMVSYSTDNGVTWQTGGNLPASTYWSSIAFGNNTFVAISLITRYSAYSTDNGITWQTGGNLSANQNLIAFDNGIFATAYTSGSSKSFYSTDNGVTWQTTNLIGTRYYSGFVGGNQRFIASYSSHSDIFAVQSDKCYTDTANPTTSSVVYSEPNVTSSYTISSVNSGAITLSNNNTYYYNQSGNVYTYDTVGNSHPEYLCFIDGVGVKMGNTVIATNTPITTTITSSSTDTEAPSAKAVYDEIGDVETALNTLNSGS